MTKKFLYGYYLFGLVLFLVLIIIFPEDSPGYEFVTIAGLLTGGKALKFWAKAIGIPLDGLSQEQLVYWEQVETKRKFEELVQKLVDRGELDPAKPDAFERFRGLYSNELIDQVKAERNSS
jgi:hypothetical protein